MVSNSSIFVVTIYCLVWLCADHVASKLQPRELKEPNRKQQLQPQLCLKQKEFAAAARDTCSDNKTATDYQRCFVKETEQCARWWYTHGRRILPEECVLAEESVEELLCFGDVCENVKYTIPVVECNA